MGGPGAERRVVVIGGGVSGLAAAHRLTEVPDPPRITLLEGASRLGGWIATTRSRGWLFEHGPDLFLASKPGAWELCQRLGIAGRLHGTSPRARSAYVVGRGRLHRLPDGLSGLVPTRIAPFVRTSVLSARGKLRVALEPFVPARRDDDDESIASFVTRRLGREMYDRLVEPLLSGIYAGDGAALGILSTFPHLREHERLHGSLLRAVLAGGGTAPSRGFATFPTGMAELPEALEARLRERRVDIRLSTPAAGLARRSDGWSVELPGAERLDADAVVVALPANLAAELLRPHTPEAAVTLAGIPLVSTATVSLGYRAADVPRPLDATGYVIPRAEGRTALACTWASAKFDGRAPADGALFRVFLGGAARAPIGGLSKEQLMRLAREELADTVGVRAQPVVSSVASQTSAMPQYLVGHRERIARVRRAVGELAGIVLAGNAYEGVGIPDCVRSGESAALQVLASFRREHE